MSQGRFGLVLIDFVLSGMMPPHLFLYDLRYCCNLKLKAFVQYPESLVSFHLFLYVQQQCGSQYSCEGISTIFLTFMVWSSILSWNGKLLHDCFF